MGLTVVENTKKNRNYKQVPTSEAARPRKTHPRIICTSILYYIYTIVPGSGIPKICQLHSFTLRCQPSTRYSRYRERYGERTAAARGGTTTYRSFMMRTCRGSSCLILTVPGKVHALPYVTSSGCLIRDIVSKNCPHLLRKRLLLIIVMGYNS